MKGTNSRAASRLYSAVMERLIMTPDPSAQEAHALALLQELGALVCDDAHDEAVLRLQDRLDSDPGSAIQEVIDSISGWQE